MKILIFGATGKIGEEISIFFSKKYDLVLSGRSKKKLYNLKKRVKKKVFVKVCNLEKEIKIKETIDFALKKMGKIDIVINSAGIFNYKNISDVNHQDLCKEFKVNAFSTLIINKYLSKKNKIKIITLGSSSGYIGDKNTFTYSGAKHALLGIVKSLNQTQKAKAILNFTINPGTIDNQMGRRVINHKNKPLIKTDQILKTIDYLISLETNGIPEEIFLKRL
tara:strand:- start:20 stop:682 length:663 start_codon:yes stop_codon:yes gene_type:complete